MILTIDHNLLMQIIHNLSLAFVENELIDEFQQLPQEMADFFQTAINWGVEAGLRLLAYMGGIALVIKLFQSK